MIRTLDITDRETARQVLEVQLSSYRVEAELTGFDGIPPLKDTVERLQACGETFLGFFQDEALAGAASYLLKGKTLDIHRVMVHPRYFRKGVATSLLRHLLTSTPQATVVEVSTGSDNPPARHLYRQLGFAEVGEEEVAPGFWMTRFRLVRGSGGG